MQIKAILNRLMTYYHIDKKKDLASILGVNPSVISNWLNRNTIDWNVIFTKCEDVDYNWLITGKTTPAANSVIADTDNTPYKEMLKEKEKEIARLNREIGRLQHAVEHLKKGGTVAGFGVEVRTELDE